MTSLQQDFAEYVRTLEHCSNSTHRAEDRPLYQAYLADAAGFLAVIALGVPADEIRERLQRHQHLWGWTYLIDPVSEAAASKWTVIRDRIGRDAI
jgi:hypothetical protein